MIIKYPPDQCIAAKDEYDKAVLEIEQTCFNKDELNRSGFC